MVGFGVEGMYLGRNSMFGFSFARGSDGCNVPLYGSSRGILGCGGYDPFGSTGFGNSFFGGAENDLMMLLYMLSSQQQSSLYPFNDNSGGFDTQSLSSQGGVAEKQSDGSIGYTTPGGYKVNINGSTVTITTPEGEVSTHNERCCCCMCSHNHEAKEKHTLVEWGDPHERLDGKELGTWTGKNRSIILPDGTIIQMEATAADGTVQETTIFSGSEEIVINNNTNSIDKVVFNPWQVMQDQMNTDFGATNFFGYGTDGQFHFEPYQLGLAA